MVVPRSCYSLVVQKLFPYFAPHVLCLSDTYCQIAGLSVSKQSRFAISYNELNRCRSHSDDVRPMRVPTKTVKRRRHVSDGTPKKVEKQKQPSAWNSQQLISVSHVVEQSYPSDLNQFSVRLAYYKVSSDEKTIFCACC